MMVGVTSNPNRYHLTLTSAGSRVMQGWWGERAVADGKFSEWIGLSKGPDARVTLVDEETGTVLTTWPEEP